MKKCYLFLVLILNVSFLAFNQEKVVCLNHDGISTMFYGDSALVYAYNSAQNNDTIYLPGGSLIYPGTIDKTLTIYGTGHYPDSTVATGITTFSGDLSIGENADKLHLEGIKITGTINFANNAKIDSVKIIRCSIASINGPGSGGSNASVGLTIAQCVVIGQLSLQNFKYGFILNNIIYNNSNYYVLYYLKNFIISNNIISHQSSSYPLFAYGNNCQFTNNIVYCYGNFQGNCYNNVITNNIFNLSTFSDNDNNYADNYFSVNLSNTFVNANIGYGSNFSYNYNYHLQNPSLYVGNDNTEVGIYGGYLPYKDGALPSNPHIQYKQISSHSSSTGKIGVQIKAAAQNE